MGSRRDMRRLVSTEMGDYRAEGPRGPWCEIEGFGDDKMLRIDVKKWCLNGLETLLIIPLA